MGGLHSKWYIRHPSAPAIRTFSRKMPHFPTICHGDLSICNQNVAHSPSICHCKRSICNPNGPFTLHLPLSLVNCNQNAHFPSICLDHFHRFAMKIPPFSCVGVRVVGGGVRMLVFSNKLMGLHLKWCVFRASTSAIPRFAIKMVQLVVKMAHFPPICLCNASICSPNGSFSLRLPL